ncbi:MAG TPA: hypothetical protein VGR26_10130, partial [Acidimicrobiales bacterium]|nr:hypothetical protein [Acidimicrobiales bacterium]
MPPRALTAGNAAGNGDHDMAHSRVGTGRQRLTAGLVFSAMVLAALSQGSAGAQVAEVTGEASGYFASLSLFGGPEQTFGPDPEVILPATGGTETATDPSAEVVIGPATFFSSGPLTVTTEGTTGPTGAVTTTATIQTINTSGDEVFTAASASSTCTATEEGNTGSTTITGGTILNHAQATDHAEEVIDIPTNPAPGHTVEGHIHIDGTQDNFRYIFNEQFVDEDGSLTVFAAHMELLGENAVGDLFIGESTCGVSTAQATTTTTAGQTTTTTTVTGLPQAPAAA